MCRSHPGIWIPAVPCPEERLLFGMHAEDLRLILIWVGVRRLTNTSQNQAAMVGGGD